MNPKEPTNRAIDAAWNAYLTGEHRFTWKDEKSRDEEGAFQQVWKQLHG